MMSTIVESRPVRAIQVEIEVDPGLPVLLRHSSAGCSLQEEKWGDRVRQKRAFATTTFLQLVTQPLIALLGACAVANRCRRMESLWDPCALVAARVRLVPCYDRVATLIFPPIPVCQGGLVMSEYAYKCEACGKELHEDDGDARARNSEGQVSGVQVLQGAPEDHELRGRHGGRSELPGPRARASARRSRRWRRGDR